MYTCIYHSSLYFVLSIYQFNFVAPKLIAFPERQTIAYGKPASFHCVATGHMLKGIKWVREGKDKFDTSTVSYTQKYYTCFYNSVDLYLCIFILAYIYSLTWSVCVSIRSYWTTIH